MSLGPGDQLGDYRIVARLGAGAYGEVFEAEHIITRRRDAIKVLSDSRLRIPEEEERFLREIRVQASLHHPNIAAVYHAFWTPHGLALVMERAPGGPLSGLLSENRLSLDEAVAIMSQTLSGLAYAHSQHVVHRDIKPENIIVAEDGSVKLTDFGLARSTASPRITQTGAAAGSPCYMSPEQAVATAPADSRSDTYSAGVVFYEMVTGRLPFTGESAFAVMLAHQNSAPQPPMEIAPAIGPGLNHVILRALEKDPERRFQNAAEFQAALESTGLGPKMAANRLLLPVTAAPSDARRKRLLVAAGICAFTTLAVSYNVFQRTHRPVAAPARNAVHPAPPASLPPPPAPTPVAPPEPEPSLAETTSTARPRATAPRIARRSPPAPQRLRITSTEAPEVPPSAPVPPLRPANTPPSRPAPLAVTSAPVVAPAMPVPEPRSISAPPAEDAKTPPVKRRNVMVRAIQRVFGRKPATNAADADTPAQPVVPRH